MGGTIFEGVSSTYTTHFQQWWSVPFRQPRCEVSGRRLLAVNGLSGRANMRIGSLQCCRRLNVLVPTCASPSANCHCCALSRVPIIKTVHIYVFLSVPLGRFANFLAESRQEVRCGGLLSRNAVLTRQGVESVQRGLHLLRGFQGRVRQRRSLVLRKRRTIRTLPRGCY